TQRDAATRRLRLRATGRRAGTADRAGGRCRATASPRRRHAPTSGRRTRTRVVVTPQVVALELEGGRDLETRHRAALRIETAEHAADHAVLPGGVDTLDHQQHTPLRLGPEPSVQLPELVELGVALFSCRRLAGQTQSGTGVS